MTKVLVSQLCPTLCNPMDCSLPGSSVHGILQARILGYHSLLQGIFPTKGLNPGLLHCRQILYHLSHQGSLLVMKALRTYSLTNFHIYAQQCLLYLSCCTLHPWYLFIL